MLGGSQKKLIGKPATIWFTGTYSGSERRTSIEQAVNWAMTESKGKLYASLIMVLMVKPGIRDLPTQALREQLIPTCLAGTI